MTPLVNDLSPAAEFCLVALVCLGVQTVSAVRAIIRRWKGTAPRQVDLGNAGVMRIVALELLCLSIALWIGSVRGWPLASFGLDITWKLTAAGILLFVGLMALASAYGAVLTIFHIDAPGRFIAPGTALPFIILLCIVNPFFEEAVFSGYFFHALQHLGMWPAVMASALFACFLHAYLGLNGATLVLLIRIAVGLVYWRWRQLWPLMVAHSLADLLALRNPLPSASPAE